MSNVDRSWLDAWRWDLLVPVGEELLLELDVDDSTEAPADLTGYTFAATLTDVRSETLHALDVSTEGNAVIVGFPAATTADLAPLGRGWRWHLFATPTDGDPMVWQFGAIELVRR